MGADNMETGGVDRGQRVAREGSSPRAAARAQNKAADGGHTDHHNVGDSGHSDHHKVGVCSSGEQAHDDVQCRNTVGHTRSGGGRVCTLQRTPQGDPSQERKKPTSNRSLRRTKQDRTISSAS